MLVRADWVDNRWVTKARFPDRSSLLTFREELVADGFDVAVEQIHEDDEGMTQFGVTDPQREVLILALDRGYYTVPRDASLSDLADELDISSQAASERLRRGTQTLVDNTLGAPARSALGSQTR
jgi:predicted DNA binding protein